MYGRKPDLTREGGSIPVTLTFSESLGVNVLLLPMGRGDDGAFDFGNAALGYAGVAFLVIGIGASLGVPTGYAINPARDLGPRLAHAVVPIRGKGGNDWGYAWIPVVGPIIGGILAGLVAMAF